MVTDNPRIQEHGLLMAFVASAIGGALRFSSCRDGTFWNIAPVESHIFLLLLLNVLKLCSTPTSLQLIPAYFSQSSGLSKAWSGA
jgi:hypothetical protein